MAPTESQSSLTREQELIGKMLSTDETAAGIEQTGLVPTRLTPTTEVRPASGETSGSPVPIACDEPLELRFKDVHAGFSREILGGDPVLTIGDGLPDSWITLSLAEAKALREWLNGTLGADEPLAITGAGKGADETTATTEPVRRPDSHPDGGLICQHELFVEDCTVIHTRDVRGIRLQCRSCQVMTYWMDHAQAEPSAPTALDEAMGLLAECVHVCSDGNAAGLAHRIDAFLLDNGPRPNGNAEPALTIRTCASCGFEWTTDTVWCPECARKRNSACACP